MSYAVKEIYYTLQGEGAQTGRSAVFCRFAGCNLWSGHEHDRATAVCKFCDTDFIGTDGPGGGRFEKPELLAAAVSRIWRGAQSTVRKFVVCTGGEPLLQLDQQLVDAFHDFGFDVAIETNGTCPSPPGIDWICLSPEAGSDVILKSGHELKLVYPQEGTGPELFEKLDFENFFLQPMDGPHQVENTKLAIAYCLEHPQWRLSIQTHKLLGLR